MTIRAVTDEEAERADYVVCAKLASFGTYPPQFAHVRARSSVEPCSHCREDILVDSLSPKTPPRICLECAVILSQSGGTVQ